VLHHPANKGGDWDGFMFPAIRTVGAVMIRHPLAIGSCTSSMRVNTRGVPGDRHKGKKV